MLPFPPSSPGYASSLARGLAIASSIRSRGLGPWVRFANGQEGNGLDSIFRRNTER